MVNLQNCVFPEDVIHVPPDNVDLARKRITLDLVHGEIDYNSQHAYDPAIRMINVSEPTWLSSSHPGTRWSSNSCWLDSDIHICLIAALCDRGLWSSFSSSGRFAVIQEGVEKQLTLLEEYQTIVKSRSILRTLRDNLNQNRSSVQESLLSSMQLQHGVPSEPFVSRVNVISVDLNAQTRNKSPGCQAYSHIVPATPHVQ